MFGSLKAKPIFSTWQPISTYVCFLIFIFPFLLKLMKLKNIVSKKKAKLINNIGFTSKEKVI